MVQGVHLGTYPFRTNIVNPHYFDIKVALLQARGMGLLQRKISPDTTIPRAVNGTTRGIYL